MGSTTCTEILSSTTEIRLLGGFEVNSRGERLDFPLAASRVIAYLALQQRSVPRHVVAGILWPESTQERAQACLRSTLWRIKTVGEGLVGSVQDSLRLDESISVDVLSSLDGLDQVDSLEDGQEPPRWPLSWLSCELLPDWHDDWVVFERERFRLAALHALDRISELCRQRGDFGAAAEYALLGIRLEPLRESSRRALITTHLAQGNHVEALHQYDEYCGLLASELGIGPTRLMIDLLEGAGLAGATANWVAPVVASASIGQRTTQASSPWPSIQAIR